MIRIGITGGIGTGKTTVCRVFEHLGIPVYYADAEASKLINEDPIIKEKLISEFGPYIYSEDGLNRDKMRHLVFNDAQALKKLNAITHPPVLQHFREWAESHTAHKYILKEAALMFESDSHKDVDRIIVVACDEETRIKRVMDRDGKTRQEIMDIIQKQLPEQEKISRAQYVIMNDEKQLLIPQVLELHTIFTT